MDLQYTSQRAKTHLGGDNQINQNYLFDVQTKGVSGGDGPLFPLLSAPGRQLSALSNERRWENSTQRCSGRIFIVFAVAGRNGSF